MPCIACLEVSSVSLDYLLKETHICPLTHYIKNALLEGNLLPCIFSTFDQSWLQMSSCWSSHDHWSMKKIWMHTNCECFLHCGSVKIPTCHCCCPFYTKPFKQVDSVDFCGHFKRYVNQTKLCLLKPSYSTTLAEKVLLHFFPFPLSFCQMSYLSHGIEVHSNKTIANDWERVAQKS